MFEVGPGTGVEFPDLGLESGERSELMSILQNQRPRLALNFKTEKKKMSDRTQEDLSKTRGPG